jgi:hypothetical protein
MANTSDLLQTGLKSIQTGFIDNQASTSGADEYANYHEITISSVDPNKCIPIIQGGVGTAADQGMLMSGASSVSAAVTATVTDATTLKVGSPVTGMDTFQFRWYVIEFH